MVLNKCKLGNCSNQENNCKIILIYFDGIIATIRDWVNAYIEDRSVVRNMDLFKDILSVKSIN